MEININSQNKSQTNSHNIPKSHRNSQFSTHIFSKSTTRILFFFMSIIVSIVFSKYSLAMWVTPLARYDLSPIRTFTYGTEEVRKKSPPHTRFTLLTVHTAHRTPQRVSHLVLAISACSVKLDIPRPGVVGRRGSIVNRLRPCIAMNTTPVYSAGGGIQMRRALVGREYYPYFTFLS